MSNSLLCCLYQIQCFQCQALFPPHFRVCFICGTTLQSQQQSAKSASHCISCSAKLLLPGQKVCHCCGILQSTQTSMVLHKEQQPLPQVNCISCSAKLLLPGQKVCHCCGIPQSTQTSMGHKEQQPLPHVSQPSHSYVFNPSQTSLLSQQVTPKHVCTDADVPHSHLPTSRSRHVPKPTLHPHSVQSSVSPTRSTVHHQNSAARCSPDSDTNSISKRSKVKIKAIMQHLNIDVMLIYNCWSTTKMLKFVGTNAFDVQQCNIIVLHACIMIYICKQVIHVYASKNNP